jgi:membrane protein implicated in regulation of membrane protease activity
MVTVFFITHWHWWGLAGLFILGELLAPCIYFMAWGVAAAITGLAVRLLPGMPGPWQLGIFAILSIITLSLAYWLRHKSSDAEADRPGQSATEKKE